MPLFSLGQVRITPGAMEALDEMGNGFERAVELLARHVGGDWDEMEKEDQDANTAALCTGARIFSAYTMQDTRFWVITEAEYDEGHRQCTTILLPEEY